MVQEYQIPADTQENDTGYFLRQRLTHAEILVQSAENSLITPIQSNFA